MLRHFLVLLLALLLSACQTSAGKRDAIFDWPYPEQPAATEPAPVLSPSENPEDPPRTAGIGEDREDPPAEIASAPPLRPLPDFPRSYEAISGPAVTSLMRQARQARGAGQPEQAQGKLERALKIEPRNYFAWSALAATYLDQRDYEQANSIAGKSNSLARGNIYVELENYRIIQEARAALGDSDGAFQAQARADQIQQRLQEGQPDLTEP